MAWEEVKYALNSSVGTDEFQSLDKIIKSQKSLVASDSELALIHDTDKYVYVKQTTELGTFTPKTTGSFRVKCVVSFGQTASSAYPNKAYIYINGQQMGASDTLTTIVTTEMSADVIITPGTSYSISAQTANNSATIENTYICASVVDTTLFEINS